MCEPPSLAEVLRHVRLSTLQRAFQEAGIRLELSVGPARAFEVGDVLHSPPAGAFCPEVAGCQRVLAVDRDWVVVRGTGYGQRVAVAQGRPDLERLIRFRNRPDPGGLNSLCCDL